MPRAALVRKPLPKPSPDSDPRYRRVMEQLKAGAAKTKAHPPAAKKASDAAAAAKGPANETIAGGKAKQVDKIQEAKEGKPEQSSFLAMLRAEIAKVMPKTLGDTENFDSTAQQVKGGLKGNVAQQKEKSVQDVSGASRATPAPGGEAKVEKPLPPEGDPAAPAVSGADGMPAPKSEADVSLQDSKQDADAQLKDAEVTPSSLQNANDPRFSAVLTAKQEVVKNADAGPGKYRAAEAATLAGAAASAASTTKAGAAAMVGVRKGGNAKVLTKQQEQKAKDEAKRKAVVDKIESIYAATKARVDAKLAAVDGEVNGMFDRGVDAALAAMTSFVNGRIRDYKIQRYLSIPLVGLARWIKDQILNLPDEVNVFYDQGRQLFQAQMDALIVRVANLVEQRLKEAKAEVTKGQAEIKTFVASQPKDLQAVAQQAQTAVASRFEELEKGIEDKKSSLAQSLAQKYKEGFDKANEALKAIQDSNKGALAGLAEKLGEVIKALAEFKARLMGILRKGEETIKLILADPIGFVGNLISAVKGGISAFLGNIKTHLANGFKKWLFGNLPPGVEIPADLGQADRRAQREDHREGDRVRRDPHPWRPGGAVGEGEGGSVEPQGHGDRGHQVVADRHHRQAGRHQDPVDVQSGRRDHPGDHGDRERDHVRGRTGRADHGVRRVGDQLDPRHRHRLDRRRHRQGRGGARQRRPDPDRLPGQPHRPRRHRPENPRVHRQGPAQGRSSHRQSDRQDRGLRQEAVRRRKGQRQGQEARRADRR
jgi:hypothetical protein